jgi:hypothetical protein
MVVPIWSITELRRPLAGTWRIASVLVVVMAALPVPSALHSSPPDHHLGTFVASSSNSVGNFSASINRLVELVALAGSGILALVWARVAMSWFSNDITKKVQAKDRARDALIGTLLFMAAVTGLLYGLAHWVLTGS